MGTGADVDGIGRLSFERAARVTRIKKQGQVSKYLFLSEVRAGKYLLAGEYGRKRPFGLLMPWYGTFAGRG